MNMKNKNKKTLKVIGIISLISIVLIVSYFIFLPGAPDTIIKPTTNLVSINGYYGSNQKLIQKGLSVVGDVEGVKYITLKLTVNNKDTVPLTFNVKNMTPFEITSARPTESLSLSPGKIGYWVTGLIDVEPYEGKIQEFCATVTSDKLLALRESSSSRGCITIKIDPNPYGNFDILLDSQIGDGNINPGCTENWQCVVFGTCNNGIQTRSCTDLNNCGTNSDKPVEQRTCVLITECNSANVGIRKCYSSTKYQTCLSSGSWSGVLSCSNSCTGQGVCS